MVWTDGQRRLVRNGGSNAMDIPTRKRFRHGRWRAFHLYQAFLIGESGFDGIVG